MLKLIAITNKDGLIATDTNELPWYIPQDLKLFKEKTVNHTCICGYNTLQSLGGIPLAHRNFIVFTSKYNLPKIKQVAYTKSISSIVDRYSNSEDTAWVIGGASIYNQLWSFCNELHVTFTEDIPLTNRGAKLCRPLMAFLENSPYTVQPINATTKVHIYEK